MESTARTRVKTEPTTETKPEVTPPLVTETPPVVESKAELPALRDMKDAPQTGFPILLYREDGTFVESVWLVSRAYDGREMKWGQYGKWTVRNAMPRRPIDFDPIGWLPA